VIFTNKTTSKLFFGVAQFLGESRETGTGCLGRSQDIASLEKEIDVDGWEKQAVASGQEEESVGSC
jgi:hypothetical protein